MMYLNHPNIVPIKEVISKDGRIYIVMEQMSFSLCNCIERCKHLLSEDQVRNILFIFLVLFTVDSRFYKALLISIVTTFFIVT